jgi:hypothetical protein
MCIHCFGRDTGVNRGAFKKGNTCRSPNQPIRAVGYISDKPYKRRGYTYFWTKTEKGWRELPAHRLVWERHYGPIPKGWIIHHINGDKCDNRLDNLECMPDKKHNKLIGLMQTRIRHLESLLKTQNQKENATES